MAYIYIITNIINNKQYVGKTSKDIQRRFNEHISKSKDENNIQPLYRAIRKYGIENFSLELLEECSLEESSEKEKGWIESKKTFHLGYNATRGGDSRNLYDYKQIANYYQKTQNQRETAKFFNCDYSVVRSACEEFSLSILSPQESSKLITKKSVEMLTLQNIPLQQFDCMMDAAKWVKENNLSIGKETSIVGHIAKVCKEKRKTAYQHKWRYV